MQHEIFRVADDQIIIEFLDEQLEERGQISQKRREIALNRWKKKDDAIALQLQSKSSTKRREEKRRESIYGDGEISIAVRTKYANQLPKRIFSLAAFFDELQKSSLELQGWIHYDPFIKANAGRVFNDDDHVYNSFRDFCKTYKAPEKPPPKYEDAAYNKSLWTLEAWEKQYDWRLKSDNDFRKHFGYEELQGGTTMGINDNGRTGAKGASGGKT
jgi:hypothetical protein